MKGEKGKGIAGGMEAGLGGKRGHDLGGQWKDKWVLLGIKGLYLELRYQRNSAGKREEWSTWIWDYGKIVNIDNAEV